MFQLSIKKIAFILKIHYLCAKYYSIATDE